MSNAPDKYFITIDGKEREVTKEEYVAQESSCGFRSKFGFGEVATASFGQTKNGHTISGRIEYTLKLKNRL